MVTATAFLMANSGARFLNGSHIQPLNLYTMSVGHPGTGKSHAIEIILAPKSKGTDLVTQVATVLSTVTYVISALFNEQQTNNLQGTISEDAFKKSME